jgi:UDP-N-acetylglucosamine 2-epimerase
VARLVGGDPLRLAELLEETYLDDAWPAAVRRVENPFGAGDAGSRVAAALRQIFAAAVS